MAAQLMNNLNLVFNDEEKLGPAPLRGLTERRSAAQKGAGSQRKAKRWAFTVFVKPDRSDEKEIVAEIMGHAHSRNMGGVMTPEQCPETGRWHLQGALICERSMSMKEIKFIRGVGTPFEKVHMSPQRESWAKNLAYCLKTGEEPYQFGDWEQLVDEMEKGKIGEQGKRSDIQKILAKMKDGATDQDLLNDDEVCGTAFRQFKWLGNVRTELLREKKADPYPWVGPTGNIIRRPEQGDDIIPKKKRHLYVWGPPNMRKSGWLNQFAGKDVFFPTRGRELEGYEGEEFIIFDMWMPEWHILEDLTNCIEFDVGKSARYKNVVIKKNQARRVIITSNNEPDLTKLTMQARKGFEERFVVFEAKKPLPVPKEKRVAEEDPII